MRTKRISQLLLIIMVLFMSVTANGVASASSGCPSQIIVQTGDTLNSIAYVCGTTADAILAVNPGISSSVSSGQVLNIPASSTTTYTTVYPTTVYPTTIVYYPVSGGTYVVQWGDTLGIIAARLGYSLYDIMAVNPQIWNPNLIYPGQVINLPAYASVPPPPIVSYAPAPVYYSQNSSLTISYKNGMIVRSGPGNEYKMINSALYKTEWQYGINTRTIDGKGQLWVQVYFYPTPQGYSSGWLLVKDWLGNYFTDPQIN